MDDFLVSLNLEESVDWLIANDAPKVGMYSANFRPLAEALIARIPQLDTRIDDYLVEAQAIRRSYELAPFVVSRSIEQARVFEDNWVAHFENAWRLLNRLFAHPDYQQLIPAEHIAEAQTVLEDKIACSYLYYNVGLHERIVGRVLEITRLDKLDIAQKAQDYTAASLKNAFKSIT